MNEVTWFAAGAALPTLVLLVILLALGRWAWNRFSRFNQITLQRESGSVVVHIDYPEQAPVVFIPKKPKDAYDEAHEP